MDKQGFPRGSPHDDCHKLRLWLAEELRACGSPVEVTVEHFPLQGSSITSDGMELLKALVTQSENTVNAHAYHSALPGTRWPLEIVVMTTDSGVITDIYYRAILTRPMNGDVAMTRSIGWFSDKFEISGPGASTFDGRKETLKAVKTNLVRIYEPPLFGFVASKKYFELPEASLSLRQSKDRGEAIIHSTVSEEGAFVGSKYSLGLKKALEILQAIEKCN